jgi:hypothetical protein
MAMGISTWSSPVSWSRFLGPDLDILRARADFKKLLAE